MTKFARGVIYLQHFIGNNKMLAGMKFVRQNLFGKKRLYLFLDITLQWPCTISRFIRIFHHFVFRCIGKFYRKLAVGKTAVQIRDQKINDSSDASWYNFLYFL